MSHSYWQRGVAGFVTASHCSPKKFEYDASPFYQPWSVGGYPIIGVEYHDPPLWPCSGLNPQCRLSDSNFNWFWYPIPFETGKIVRTQFAGVTGPGSLDQDPAAPFWSIDAKYLAAVPVGLNLNKVGRTTGWTTGTVTQSCVHFPAEKLRCQVVSSIFSAPGDSGSPIFHRLPPSSFVTLHGVLWGGPSSNYSVTYHSPWTGVRADLGDMKVCTAAYSC